MQSVIQKVEAKYKKSAVVDVQSGDTVKVHQKIREGNKERVQIFQGMVIRTDRKGSHTSRITVRRIASGVGVEKSFLLHSPLVLKVEVTKRSKPRPRLPSVDLARTALNSAHARVAEEKKAKLPAEKAAAAEADAAKKAEEEA